METPQDLLTTHSSVWVKSSHTIPDEFSHKKYYISKLNDFPTEYDKEITVLSAACHTEQLFAIKIVLFSTR